MIIAYLSASFLLGYFLSFALSFTTRVISESSDV